MRAAIRKAAKRLTAAGAALWLAAVLGYALGPERVSALTEFTAAQSMAVSSTSGGAWSFGEWHMGAAGWVPGTPTSGYASANVPLLLFDDVWLCCVLYDYAVGHNVEATWLWNSALP